MDERLPKSKHRSVQYSDYYQGGSTVKKDYLTDWWKGWGYSGASATEQKLAIALGAIRTTVDVVYSSGKRYSVRLASDHDNEAPTSYTSFDDHQIVVSPMALVDKSVNESDGIRISSGFGLHEASHAQYSEPLIGALRQPTELDPMTIAQLLHNLLEDLRIEAKTSDKFPGFADYFDKANAYLWKKTGSHAPTEWTGQDLDKKCAAIIGSAKWPVEYGAIVDGATDPALKDHYAWFKAWGERYRDDKVDIRTALVEAIARLMDEPETKQQMAERSKQEKQWQKGASIDLTGMSDDEFQKWLEEMRKALSKPGLEPCPSPGHGIEIKLDPKQAAKIQELLDNQLQKQKANLPEQFPDGQDNSPEITIQRPAKYNAQWYTPPKASLVARMKSAFFFRKAAPSWSERLLKAGAIDDEELWRVADNDFRVFERRVVEESPDTQVTMLIDLSRSMSGDNTENAQAMATVMLECLRLMKGVSVRIRGHRTEGNGCGVFRIWEPGDPMQRLALITELNGGSNYDGYAIDWCANELVEVAKSNEDKVLIVLSDGRPNGHAEYYGGEPAMDHVRRVVEHYERQGVTTIQIAIDPAVGANIQAHMFRHFIPFIDGDKLPGQLTNMLIKLFSVES